MTYYTSSLIILSPYYRTNFELIVANESHKNFKGIKPSLIAALFMTTLVYFLIQTALINTSKGPAWRDMAYFFLWWPMLAPLLIVGLPLITKLLGK